jgi:histidine triad (HIT) family protein
MYTHAPENYLCPFCLLVQGVENEYVYSARSDIIYQDESVTAFIGSHQWSRNHGNTIIIPNEHFENIFDLPDRYPLAIHRVAKLVALAMKKVYSCDGISMRQHNEPAGYQDVWHYHVHVTPRYMDDQFYLTYQEKKMMPASKRSEYAGRLKIGLTQFL